MDIPEGITENTKVAIEKRNKDLADAAEQVAKLNISEPVKQWVKDKEENPLGGKELKTK